MQGTGLNGEARILPLTQQWLKGADQELLRGQCGWWLSGTLPRHGRALGSMLSQTHLHCAECLCRLRFQISELFVVF